MSGQQAGTVVGFVAGFFLPGGPQVWATVGGVVGSYISPTVFKGPSIGDAQQQTSRTGMPIPKAFGHPPPFAPTLVDGDKVARKIKKKQSNGKGAPTQTEYEAFIATRAFLIGEQISAVARITRNGKLVYSTIAGDNIDADSAVFASQLRIYYGSRDQGPDPSLEAIHGVENTNCYPGRAYFVVIDDDETDTRGAANQYRVEVIASGTLETNCATAWIATDGFGKFVRSDGTDWTSEAAYTVSGVGGRDLLYNGTALVCSVVNNTDFSLDKGLSWAPSTIDSQYGSSDGAHGAVADRNTFALMASGHFAYGTNGDVFVSREVSLPDSNPICIAGGFGFLVAGGANGAVNVSFDLFETSTYQVISTSSDYFTAMGSNGIRVIGAQDSALRTFYTDNGMDFFEGGNLPSGAIATTKLTANGTFWVCSHSTGLAYSNDNGASWHACTIPAAFICRDVKYGAGLWVACGERGVNPIIMTSTDGINWTERANNFAFNDQVFSVEFMDFGSGMSQMPDGGSVYYDSFGNIHVQCTSRSTEESTLWRDVATEICGRASPLLLDHIDFANMPDEVPGFLLGNSSLKGTDYLRTLLLFYFADAPEVDDKIRTVRRGGAPVGTLESADLMRIEDQDDDLWEQPIVGWRRLTITYPDPANNYVPSTQVAPRTSPDVSATSDMNIECPIPFDATTAAQKADIIQKIKFCELEGTFTRAFPAEYDKFVPSDPVTFEDRRQILTKKSFDLGLVKFEGRYDRASAYTSVAVGTNAPAPSKQASNLKGPTFGQFLNLPRLKSSENSPGMYVFVCGLVDGWPGCDLYVSIDGGLTELKAATIRTPSIMGRLTADLLIGGSPLDVQTYNDDVLESVTDEQIAARMNALAITSGGVSEIAQFKDASETSTLKVWELTTLYRGLLDTIEADHTTGDEFVLLDGSYLFLPLDSSLIGKELIFRPATLGTPVANNPTYRATFSPYFTDPEVIEFLADESGAQLLDESELPLQQE